MKETQSQGSREKLRGKEKKTLQLSDTSHYVHGTFYFLTVWFSLPSHKNLFLYLNVGLLEDNQVCLLYFVYLRERMLSSMEHRGFEIPTPNPAQLPLLPSDGPCLCSLRTFLFNQIFSKLNPSLKFPPTALKYFGGSILRITSFIYRPETLKFKNI